MSKYQESPEMAEIGQYVIENVPELEYLGYADLRITYIMSSQRKSSASNKVLGECIKVSDIQKVHNPYDFMIVFYEPNIAGMTVEQLRMLMEHEMLHIGYDPEYDPPKYFVRPHDYDDFKQITDKYGTDWAKVDEYEG